MTQTETNEQGVSVAEVQAGPVIPNGEITLTNRETGEHRTFRIRTNKEDARFAPGERVIALLTGPDNTTSYTGFGRAPRPARSR